MYDQSHIYQRTNVSKRIISYSYKGTWVLCKIQAAQKISLVVQFVPLPTPIRIKVWKPRKVPCILFGPPPRLSAPPI